MAEKNFISTTAWLTVEPTYNRIGSLDGAKVSKVTQSKPRTPEGFPVIKLQLQIPLSRLEALVANLVIPEDGIGTIEAQVEMPEEGETE